MIYRYDTRYMRNFAAAEVTCSVLRYYVTEQPSSCHSDFLCFVSYDMERCRYNHKWKHIFLSGLTTPTAPPIIAGLLERTWVCSCRPSKTVNILVCSLHGSHEALWDPVCEVKLKPDQTRSLLSVWCVSASLCRYTPPGASYTEVTTTFVTRRIESQPHLAYSWSCEFEPHVLCVAVLWIPFPPIVSSIFPSCFVLFLFFSGIPPDLVLRVPSFFQCNNLLVPSKMFLTTCRCPFPSLFISTFYLPLYSSISYIIGRNLDVAPTSWK